MCFRSKKLQFSAKFFWLREMLDHDISHRQACRTVDTDPKTVRREGPPDNPMIRREKNPSRSKVAGLGIGDPARGSRSREAADRKRDVSFLVGADYTYVDHSDFFSRLVER